MLNMLKYGSKIYKKVKPCRRIYGFMEIYAIIRRNNQYFLVDSSPSVAGGFQDSKSSFRRQ
jgi:hypothetical protein